MFCKYQRSFVLENEFHQPELKIQYNFINPPIGSLELLILIVIPLFPFSGCAIDQRPICIDSYSGSLTSSKRRDCYPCGGPMSDPYNHCSSSVLMQLPNGSLHRPPHKQGDRPPSVDDGEGSDYGRAHERLSPSNTFMGRSDSAAMMGFFSSISVASAPANGTYFRVPSVRNYTLHISGIRPSGLVHTLISITLVCRTTYTQTYTWNFST